MAKITPIDFIRSLSGKVCQYSDTYFTNRFGTTYTAKRCNKRSTPFSEQELKNQQNFKTARAAAIARSQDTLHAPDELKTFKSQKHYKTFLGYLTAKAYSLISEEGTVKWDN